MIEVSRKGRTIPSLPSFPPCLNDVKEDPSLSLAPPMGAQTPVEELDAGARGFLRSHQVRVWDVHRELMADEAELGRVGET